MHELVAEANWRRKTKTQTRKVSLSPRKSSEGSEEKVPRINEVECREDVSVHMCEERMKEHFTAYGDTDLL